ncbi:carbohydrate kinase family protein [Paracoccus aerodenitrificans]|uniref:carbohydrate kinase family protein n=1 Tax=Paracoccus aerodenitrificans TaxID=3017781 RepID=UPI0022F0D8CB|nr:carbohydrate kinase [Paracoccus aerodenitrificans]WBU65097.1 carbohydrate kinase [Paracoccus aerodenitrificans]
MILCCGESLIDMVPQDGAFLPLPGGSVYNTTVALGRLGAKPSYLWPLSTDDFGAALRAPLEKAGVDMSLCPSTDRLTTLAFVFLNDGHASYSFYDEGTAGRMFDPADIPELPADVSALFIGGISLIQDPCGNTVLELANRVAEKGAVIKVDLNIRPNLVADERLTRERLNGLMRIADIVKISDDDAEWLFPDNAPEDTAVKLLDIGPKLILRTHGAEGATAIHKNGQFTREAERVEIADTIGAGDTFNAGFLTALSEAGALSKDALAELQEDTIRAALDLAAKAAAVTVSRHGANPPWREELSA